MSDLSTSEPVVKWSEQWWANAGAVNLAGAQRDRGVQGLGGLGVGGMGQAAAVSPVTSFQTASRRVISVR